MRELWRRKDERKGAVGRCRADLADQRISHGTRLAWHPNSFLFLVAFLDDRWILCRQLIRLVLTWALAAYYLPQLSCDIVLY